VGSPALGYMDSSRKQSLPLCDRKAQEADDDREQKKFDIKRKFDI